MGDAWHEGLLEPLKPDVDRRECCKSVLFGGLTSLLCAVETEFFGGSFKLDVKYCPHCGREMSKVRAEVLFELENEYQTPREYLKSHPDAFGGVFGGIGSC